MVKSIKKGKNPDLKVHCDEIQEITPKIKKTIQNMKDTLSHYGALGIAANQIGEKQRIIAVRLAGRRYPVIMCNPTLTIEDETPHIALEGCLSFPGKQLFTARPRKVTVEYKNESLTPEKLELEALDSVIVQHEIDHINGVLFTELENTDVSR